MSEASDTSAASALNAPGGRDAIEDVDDLAPDPTTGRRDYRAYLERVTTTSAHVAGIVDERRQALERTRRLGPLVAATQRFLDIEGTELGALVALYVVVGIFPLLIIAFGLATDFSATASFGNLMASVLRVQGTTADIVRNTFSTSASARTVATVFGAGSFVLVGLSLASTMRKAFARSWKIPYEKGVAAQAKGLAWFTLLLVFVIGGAALESVLSGGTRSLVFRLAMLPVTALASFVLWWITPRLLLDKPLGWKALIPSALAGTLVSLITRVSTVVILPTWFEYYGDAFGGFGVVVALAFWIWLLAYGWVAIAAFGAVLWERTASEDRVLAIQLDDALDAVDERNNRN